ncbi:hypothetical protein IFM89_019286 [Coptis chinensis]|uniref:DNA2/NAM7 helicase helicase domain-containing protein n=1 Tax=Coptis chinensis TaxID=261450 RepID=A0A835H770_9MAGN|nr:hypothetical protein IFM89_019286 [Coptis chinensis]
MKILKEVFSTDTMVGPPGTGKTKTVSTLLCALLRMNYNIVACAPTNVAIDELSTRVLKLNASKRESEAVKESGSGRCSGHSFLKFIRERYTDAARITTEKVRCITTLGTCLTADFLLQYNYKNMSILLGLLDSFECVLSRDDVVEEELKELFAEEVLNKNASLSSRGLSGNETVKCHSLDRFYKIRCESLILLTSLSNDLNLPGHMDICAEFGSKPREFFRVDQMTA